MEHHSNGTHITDVVIGSLEATLLNHLGTEGFTLKLNC
jgi:hypothetical protein